MSLDMKCNRCKYYLKIEFKLEAHKICPKCLKLNSVIYGEVLSCSQFKPKKTK